jgi:hypothetical protein
MFDNIRDYICIFPWKFEPIEEIGNGHNLCFISCWCYLVVGLIKFLLNIKKYLDIVNIFSRKKNNLCKG